MTLFRVVILVSVMGLLAACQGPAASPLEVSAFAEEQRFMQEYGDAFPPVGYISFCRREPGECTELGSKGRVVMTAERWIELNTVNTRVNSAVLPATDLEAYNQPEYWTLPQISGDCEDYVLQKRKLLIDRGWPSSALLITVVRDEDGEGHAVLSVLTDMGDLILDNKNDLIRPWSDTRYVYYKRQSHRDPARWAALTPLAQTNSALAATQSMPE